MYVCVSVWIYVHHMPVGAQGGQRVLGSLELELQVFVNHLIWILGTKPGFSARAVVFLNTEPPLQSQFGFFWCTVQILETGVPTSWLWKRNSTPLLALREDFSEELTDESFNTLRTKLDHIFFSDSYFNFFLRD